MKYAIFGTGMYGEMAHELLEKENILFFIDNDSKKYDKLMHGFEIMSLEKAISMQDDLKIIIAVSNKYEDEIVSQLKRNGISDYKSFNEIKFEITKKRISERTNYISVYNKAVSWIKNNNICGQSIICSTNKKLGYPEVTGYYIPTLIKWGYKDLAKGFAKWLLSIQKEDGSWFDTDGKAPYIFDSAQILKGLVAIRDIYEDKNAIDIAMKKGTDWILSCMTDTGRLITSSMDAWGNDEKICSEIIHIYCLSPIIDVGRILKCDDYEKRARKIFSYYKENYYEKIMSFSLLSHFYAYLMEALLDLGEIDMAKAAMKNMEKYQKQNGAVPAYNNVDWVCSTGLFQLAVVWFRLGEYERGNKAFDYACKLQNKTGGWYGSYLSECNSTENNTYFPDAEISWAVKYFLDALYYKNLAQFNKQASLFQDTITEDDGRYKEIKLLVSDMSKCGKVKVLDIGCGKGRYLKNLIKDMPYNQYFAVDLSLPVMDYLNIESIIKKQGSLTNIPYPDNSFDIAYTCEALEHAVDVSTAICEMCRVVRNDGIVAIIDKNKDKLGYFEIEEWEQWFDEIELKKELSKYCSEVSVIKEITFDNMPSNGLFYCWIGRVKKG